ncbi:MAG: insulinase family protein [Lactobacillus sp.]|jgi:predicted Zn-dependent peptidase|nr:insulinase family protein [Lactobacillus sp.]
MSEHIYLLPEHKFSTGNLGCFFCFPLTQANIAKASLLNFMQNNASQNYPSMYLQTKYLASLYDAHFSAYTQVMGQTLLVSYTLNYVEPRAVLNPDYDSQQVVSALAELVQQPLLTPINFQLAKLQLQDAWHDVYDLPSNLAAQRFFASLFADQRDLIYSIFGPLDTISSLQLSDLQDFYDKMLQQPAMFIGQGAALPSAAEIAGQFNQLDFGQTIGAVSSVPADPPAKVVTEKNQFDQSQLVLGFVYNDTLPYFSREILGEFLAAYLAGDESSILFQRVREQLGAAYAIDGSNYPALSLLVISASLDKQKKDIAQQAITKAILDLQAGQLNHGLFEKCKQNMIRRFLTSNDNAAAIFERTVIGKMFNCELTSRACVRTVAQLSPAEFLDFASKLELKESYCLQ